MLYLVKDREVTNFLVASQGSNCVKMSAIFSADSTYLNIISPDFVCSFTKWCCISMCFVLLWFLCLMLLEIAPLLLVWIIIGFVVGSPTSSKYLDIQITWVAAHKKAIYSASTVDRTTIVVEMQWHVGLFYKLSSVVNSINWQLTTTFYKLS